MQSTYFTHLFDNLLQRRHNLDTGRTDTDDGSGDVAEVHAVVPTCRVQQRPFEIVKALDIGPFPVIQDTCRLSALLV